MKRPVRRARSGLYRLPFVRKKHEGRVGIVRSVNVAIMRAQVGGSTMSATTAYICRLFNGLIE